MENSTLTKMLYAVVLRETQGDTTNIVTIWQEETWDYATVTTIGCLQDHTTRTFLVRRGEDANVTTLARESVG